MSGQKSFLLYNFRQYSMKSLLECISILDMKEHIKKEEKYAVKRIFFEAPIFRKFREKKDNFPLYFQNFANKASMHCL